MGADQDWSPAVQVAAVAVPATKRVLAALAVGGLLFDFAGRAGALGLAASGVIAIASLFIRSRLSGHWAKLCCVVAALAGLMLGGGRFVKTPLLEPFEHSPVLEQVAPF